MAILQGIASRSGAPHSSSVLTGGISCRRTDGQLARFVLVGGLGYVVNLASFTGLRVLMHVPLHAAAVAAFAVTLFHNYTLNRIWTFGIAGRSFGQFGRFVVVSLATLTVNLILLRPLTRIGVPDVGAEAVAILVATPLSFAMNRRWSFNAGEPRGVR